MAALILRRFLVAATAVGCVAAWPVRAQDADRAAGRAAMIATIESYTPYATEALGDGGIDPAVLDVMAAVPRHAFVPESQQPYAYDNRPLPIGYGQTISQPFIVALMTDLLDVAADDVVLEIGTGSGYQAAVLSPLAAAVYSIEIVPELGHSAADRLAALGYANVTVKVGDGYYGWPEHAPFDGIVVTAAAGQIPPPLIAQLAEGGRMVIPVGPPFLTQQLLLVEKQADGTVTTRQLLPVSFVPFTRGPEE